MPNQPPEELPKQYDPASIEGPITERWLASKAFALEELGRTGSVDGAGELAADLEALFEEASGALTSWLSAA